VKERITVRLLLLDRAGRILLMKIHDPAITAADGGPSRPCWITTGGGVEAGESILEAAAREALEESGIPGVTIGEAVQYIEQVIVVHGEPVLFKETYVLAHAPDAALHRTGWTDLERQVVKNMRWWTLEELQSTEEVVFPVGLAGMMAGLSS
jgi:8-oxo-dGTP pyrophosphatase MutT (NUDIX family)